MVFRFFPVSANIPRTLLLLPTSCRICMEVAQTTFDHTIVDLPTNLDEEQVKVITRHAAVESGGTDSGIAGDLEDGAAADLPHRASCRQKRFASS